MKYVFQVIFFIALMFAANVVGEGVISGSPALAWTGAVLAVLSIVGFVGSLLVDGD